MSDTQTGLQENVAGVLCYVLGWVSGIIFLIIEPKNQFVRFHAFQSIIVFGIIQVFWFVIFWIPFVGLVLGWLAWAFWFILWIILMVNAAQNRQYKLPWAGDLAEKWASQGGS